MKTPYGLIGEKLGHSYSVPIHNTLGNYDYTLREVAKEDLNSFMLKHNFKGINVTIPYKTDVIPYLDEISDEAKRINSVNTIVNKGGKLHGYNTDYYGFSYMAKNAGITFNNKKVLILGSGGTSLTARTVAADEGAKEIVIISRNGENNYSNLDKHKDADVIINTTPVGMFPKVDFAPLSLEHFDSLSGVIDVIYNPRQTNLLIDAKRRKIPCTNGLVMLAAQAKKAHELFFDTTVDDSLIEKAVNDIESQKRNIVLVGMPGCGKSTVAKRLCEILDMKLCDTDDMIVKYEGRTIPQIFKENGEKYFREAESKAVKEASGMERTVIATGGGAVMSEENQNALLHNAIVVWLDRPIESLATRGRPLSKDIDTLTAMYNMRKPIYASISDFKVITHSHSEETCKYILERLM